MADGRLAALDGAKTGTEIRLPIHSVDIHGQAD
jgi:hypothetical protein